MRNGPHTPEAGTARLMGRMAIIGALAAGCGSAPAQPSTQAAPSAGAAPTSAADEVYVVPGEPISDIPQESRASVLAERLQGRFVVPIVRNIDGDSDPKDEAVLTLGYAVTEAVIKAACGWKTAKTYPHWRYTPQRDSISLAQGKNGLLADGLQAVLVLSEEEKLAIAYAYLNDPGAQHLTCKEEPKK